MGKQTTLDNIKEWLAGVCWYLFLRLNNLTENEYFRQIKEQELRTSGSRPLDALVMPKNADTMPTPHLVCHCGKYMRFTEKFIQNEFAPNNIIPANHFYCDCGNIVGWEK